MKKYFAILTAALLLSAFSGCTEGQAAETTELSINAEDNTNNTTADVTIEDIVSNMEVCGHKISLPFKAADLPNDFKIDENGSYVQSTDSTGFAMYYKGEEIAYVYCSGKCENSSDAAFTSICFGMFNPVPEINIMGITRDSDYDYVTEKLGTINLSSDQNELRYVFSNSNQVLIHFEDDTQKAINFLSVYYEETVNSETTAPINSDEIHNETNFEITDWTFEDFVSDVEINGVKLSLPCSYEELSKLPDLQKRKNAIDDYYDEEAGKRFYLYTYEIRTKDNLFLVAEYCSENGDGAPEAEDMTEFFAASALTDDNTFLFSFGEINNYSDMTRNDVEKILGKPNDNVDVNSWYWFGDRKAIVIDYDKNNRVEYVNCFFGENN